MKKYTLKIRALDPSVTASTLRIAIDSILLRLHPRVTYRLGLVSQTDPSSFLVEIASDGKKELLESHLKAIQEELPVTIEKLGWGWIASEVTGSPGKLGPEAGALSFSLNTKTFLFRYILLVSTTFALVALLVARFYLDEILWLDYTYYAVFLVWIVSLNETPLDIRLFVQRIDCEPAELAVTYSFGNKTVRMGWETIWGLDHQTTICTLYRRDRKPIRFFIDSGFKDKDSLLAAITQRASLNNIESGIGKAVYRHYESP